MNQLTVLEPRLEPISQKDYIKLEELIEENFDLKQNYVECRKNKVDNMGDVYGQEYDITPTSLVLKPKKDNVPEKLMDSLRRPVTGKSIGYQLTRLSAYKRFTGGAYGLEVTTEDAIKDLKNTSEWAFMKACEETRKETGVFFEYDKFIKIVIRYNDALYWKAPEPKAKEEEEAPIIKTDKSKRRVARIMKLSLKAREKWTKWEKRFMEGMKE